MENKELIFNAVQFAKQNATDNEISVEEVAGNAGFSIESNARACPISTRLSRRPN